MQTGWGLHRGLEERLQGQLEYSGVERASYGPEVSSSEFGADSAVIAVTLELGVVPNVEALRSELEFETLGEGKVLQERQVPVVTARST